MNAHTARARAAAKRDYLLFVERAGMEDLAAWVDDMHSRHLSANTIRQRVYLVRSWLGGNYPIQLPARHPIRERKWLDAEQTRALLAVIPRHEAGRRDFALLAALLVSGQRVGQTRAWRWQELHTKAISQVLLDAIQSIPNPAGDSYSSDMRLFLGTVQNNYVFATTGRHLKLEKDGRITASPSILPPISPQEINRRIRRYARLAGLEPQGISAECLRRTRQELGEHTVTLLVQQALEARNIRPVRWKRMERDTRLHGLGRRRL